MARLKRILNSFPNEPHMNPLFPFDAVCWLLTLSSYNLQAELDFICHLSGLEYMFMPSTSALCPGLQANKLHSFLKCIILVSITSPCPLAICYCLIEWSLIITLSCPQLFRISCRVGWCLRQAFSTPALFTAMTLSNISYYTDKDPCKPSWLPALFNKLYHWLTIPQHMYA